MEQRHLRPIGAHKRTYREAAYAAIRAAILADELPFDAPLVEEQLAAQLSISRTPVREALAILEHEALLGPGEGRGLYIRVASPRTFDALLTAIEIVGTHLVRRAAHLITEELLQALGETLHRNRYHADRGHLPGFLETGRRLWELVGDAAENPPLRDVVVDHTERADLYILAHSDAVSASDMAVTHREYAAVLDALVKRDPDEAARLVTYHAQSLRARLPGLFEAAEPGEQGDWHDDLGALL